MRSATLRQSGGSIIVSLPKSALDKLGLGADTAVEIDVEGDSIVIRRRRRGRIGLAARLALCDFTVASSSEASDFIAAPAVGREWGSRETLQREDAADPAWVQRIEELYDAAG